MSVAIIISAWVIAIPLWAINKTLQEQNELWKYHNKQQEQ
jgi:hypothetical protein